MLISPLQLATNLPVDAAAVAVQDVLLYTLFPVGATILGGVVAAFRTPSARIQSAIQHFAAGVVFAAVAVELLPDELQMHAPLPLIGGFVLGVAVMRAVNWLGQKLEPPEERENAPHPRLGRPSLIAAQPRVVLPLGLLMAVGVDITLDGLLVGVAFAAGAHAGLLITLALTLEVLFLGLSTATALQRGGASRRRVLVITSSLALLIALGALIGSLVFGGAAGAPLAVVLAFGLAALLYLVTEELLVEAHEVPETMWATATFFAGFLVILLITLYTGE